MKVYQLVVPAHQVSSTALARAEEWIKRARQSIAKTEGISRRDLAVVEPKDAPEPFDPWAVEAKEV